MKYILILIVLFQFSFSSLFSQKKVNLKDLNYISKDFQQINRSYFKYNDLFYQNRKSDFDLNPHVSVEKMEEYFMTGKGDTIDFSFRFFNEFGDLDSIIRQKETLSFSYSENQVLTKMITKGKNGTETIRLDDSTFFSKGSGFSSPGYWGRDSYIQYQNSFERHYLQNDSSKHFTLEIEFKNGKVFRYSDKKLNRGDIFSIYDENGNKTERIRLQNLKTDTASHTKWFYSSEGFIEREIQKGIHKSQNWDAQFQHSIIDLENGNKALKQQKIIGDTKGEIVVYYLDKNLNWTSKETIQVNGNVAMKKIRKITYRK